MRTRRITNEAERLSVVARYRQNVADDDPFCASVVRMLKSHFGATAAYLSFIQEEREWLIAYRGMDIRDLSREDEVLQACATAEDLVLIEDLHGTSRNAALAARYGMPRLRCLAVAPLVSPEGALVGTLGMLDNARRTFSDDDQTFLLQLAEVAIDGLDGRRTQATASPVTDPAVHDLLKSEIYLLHTLMDHLPDNIYFKDPESRFVRVNAAKARRMGFDDAALAVGLTDFDIFSEEHAKIAYRDEREIIRTGVPIVNKEEKLIWPDGHVTWASSTKLPLRDETGKVIGTFGLSRDVTDRKLAQQAVVEHAQVVEQINARHDAELALASELQRAFLPECYPCFPPDGDPDASRLKFSHLYLPTEEVGGDFFSLIPLSRSSVGVLVCDVVGHGVRAALVTAMINALVKDLVSYAPDPAVFMQLLNERLWAALGGRFGYGFVTAFYAAIYVDELTIRYAGAGHPSPVVLRRDRGVVEPMVSGPGMTGLALLLTENPTYTTHEVSLSNGDGIVLYTDGIYEVYGGGHEEFGMDRMVEAMKDRLDARMSDLLRHIISEARDFSDSGEFQDDVCLVGIDLARG